MKVYKTNIPCYCGFYIDIFNTDTGTRFSGNCLFCGSYSSVYYNEIIKKYEIDDSIAKFIRSLNEVV